MPRTCTVCGHASRPQIDAALVAGGSLRDIAGQFRVSKSAVERHHNEHLPATLTQAKDAEDVRHAIDVYRQLKAINGATLSILQEARASRDHDIALKAIDRVQRQIELQAKLLGELDQEGTTNITIAPQWVAVRTVILEALEPFPAAQQAIVRAFREAEADAA